MTDLTVIYDGECGLCNALRQWVETRDTANHVHFEPNQTADLNTIAPRLTRAMVHHAVVTVRSDGEHWRGARAIFETLRHLPGLWHAIGSIGAVPVISGLAEPFYQIVAHHRARLSRWAGLETCQVEFTEA